MSPQCKRYFTGSTKIACQQIQCVIKRLYFPPFFFLLVNPAISLLSNTLIVELLNAERWGEKKAKLNVGVQLEFVFHTSPNV